MTADRAVRLEDNRPEVSCGRDVLRLAGRHETRSTLEGMNA